MKKAILTAAALIAISTTAQAGSISGSDMSVQDVMSWEEWARSPETATMENCLNGQGKAFAWMRKGYCEDKVAAVKAYYEAPAKAAKQKANDQKFMEDLIDAKLVEVKAQGKTCAKRHDGDGMAYIMCKDEVGSYKLVW